MTVAALVLVIALLGNHIPSINGCFGPVVASSVVLLPGLKYQQHHSSTAPRGVVQLSSHLVNKYISSSSATGKGLPGGDRKMKKEEAAGLLSKYLSDSQAEKVLSTPGLINHLDTEGIESRLKQLEHLVHVGVVKDHEQAKEDLVQQPFFLEQCFKTIYEGQGITVLDKPWDTRIDIKCQASRHFNGERTCHDWLKRMFPLADTMRFCHQLDYATSGVLVWAHTRMAANAVSKQFRERIITNLHNSAVTRSSIRRARKEYEAIVFGHPEFDSTVINTPVGPHPEGGFCMVASPETNGKVTETYVEVVERCELALPGHPREGQPVALVRMKPVTGRRHQLRVHMACLGHPIVGDANYAKDWVAYRMMLHATRLVLPLDAGELDLRAQHDFRRHLAPISKKEGK